MFETRPGQSRQSSRTFRYMGLRLVSYLLRILGWFAIAASIIGLMIGYSVVADQSVGGVNVVVQSIIFSLSVSGLMWGIVVIAFGELLKVMVDIALNTAPLSAIAQDTNYFYERFSYRDNPETSTQ